MAWPDQVNFFPPNDVSSLSRALRSVGLLGGLPVHLLTNTKARCKFWPAEWEDLTRARTWPKFLFGEYYSFSTRAICHNRAGCLCISWRKDLFTEPKGKTILSSACNYFAKGINLYIKRWWGFSPPISPQKGAFAKFCRVRMCAPRKKDSTGFTFGRGFEMLQMCGCSKRSKAWQFHL